jgi:hypothetical protein
MEKNGHKKFQFKFFPGQKSLKSEKIRPRKILSAKNVKIKKSQNGTIFEFRGDITISGS